MKQATAEIQPVQRRASIGADIASQLQRLIQNGTYPPGTALPSQRELARKFGASVPSVREAISVLIAAGMLEARTGHGTTVRSFTSNSAAFDGWLGVAGSSEDLQDLLQARRILEEFTLTAAAGKLNADNRQLLYGVLDEMRAALHDPEAYVNADIKLHMAIADIAGNRVVSRLMRIIQAPLRRQLSGNVHQLHRNGQLEQSLRDHEDMLAALCDGKPAKAFASINKMLERAERFGKAETRE